MLLKDLPAQIYVNNLAQKSESFFFVEKTEKLRKVADCQN
jgi:hypothetical protein